jgi:hypothetical protein
MSRYDDRASNTDLLLASIILNRHDPLAPHHIGAIRERLRYLKDSELQEMVITGKWPTKGGDSLERRPRPANPTLCPHCGKEI